MTRILLLVLFAALPFQVAAGETDYVKYICTDPHGAAEVVHKSNELIMGLSPLPSGCEWLLPGTVGDIHETLFHMNTPNQETARIAEVTVNGEFGYSSGIVWLLF